ncbi:hypothetical protein OBBRIDRAFT_875335 [Obba rivulosa]|uniref:Uncharacterized protein n=1 Tax=Obba rivulosa TaxID=1052685 RepID=A0A8E2AVA4_9APHY|nr:hypothetical protein OBBRIDRAFT_875335 [Obba rivulosa]
MLNYQPITVVKYGKQKVFIRQWIEHMKAIQRHMRPSENDAQSPRSCLVLQPRDLWHVGKPLVDARNASSKLAKTDPVFPDHFGRELWPQLLCLIQQCHGIMDIQAYTTAYSKFLGALALNRISSAYLGVCARAPVLTWQQTLSRHANVTPQGVFIAASPPQLLLLRRWPQSTLMTTPKERRAP